MPKRIYDGPAPAVDVYLRTGTGGIVTAVKGELVELPDEVCRSLDETGEWKKHKTTAATGEKE